MKKFLNFFWLLQYSAWLVAHFVCCGTGKVLHVMFMKKINTTGILS